MLIFQKIDFPFGEVVTQSPYKPKEKNRKRRDESVAGKTERKRKVKWRSQSLVLANFSKTALSEPQPQLQPGPALGSGHMVPESPQQSRGSCWTAAHSASQVVQMSHHISGLPLAKEKALRRQPQQGQVLSFSGSFQGPAQQNRVLGGSFYP